jgi:hypothetical protein
MSKLRILCALGAAVATIGLCAAPASAESLSSWFHLTSVSRPGHLSAAKGEIALTAINLGDAAVRAAGSPVVITDELPEHVSARFAKEGFRYNSPDGLEGGACEIVEPKKVVCTFPAGTLPPYHQIEILIGVRIEKGAQTGEENVATLSGGGTPGAHTSHPITVDNNPTPFGVETYESLLEEAGGSLDTQAGSHPFQYTTVFDFNASTAYDGNAGKEVAVPAALAKDVVVKLPPGLIGNPTAYPRCSLGEFLGFTEGEIDRCPSDTAVGVVSVTYSEMELGGALGLTTRTVPVFNLEPAPGEPARFGFAPAGVPVYLDTSVRTGEDYGVTVTVSNVSQTIGFLSNTLTFWGVPGDQRHNGQRSFGCLEEGEGLRPSRPCEPIHQSNPPAFLTLPTACSGEPLQVSGEGDPWVSPGRFFASSPDPTVPMTTLDGCGLLPFHSEIKVTPDLDEGSSPSGLTVDVHVPQEESVSGEGLANPDVKNITVTLPDGVALNPSSADGLAACSAQQVGFVGMDPATGTARFTDQEVSCPNASKIATVKISTPLLTNSLNGFVYLASPQNFAGPLQNPFGSLVAMYLVARDPVSGTLVKLPGSVSLDQTTGQITSMFAGTPQLPFEDAEISFFGGERAPLATPPRCGGYTTDALFEPWTNTAQDHEVLSSSSTFDIGSGPNGSPCPGASLPFSPALSSETTNVNAGGFTPLSTTISRADGQQDMQSVVLHYPPGVSGLLSGVALCPEAQANAGTCSPESLIGETIVSVGVGGDPFSVTGGKVYITEKYDGAPFGLSIVNPAKAGPFVLQEGRPVVVRAKIEIDPLTAALTITTDPSGPHAIPMMLDGIPLEIQHVNVLVNRPGFTFNSTDCEPTSITGTISSAEGGSSTVNVPFQVTNCAVLGFKPQFKVQTTGKTSRQNGASLHVLLSYPKAPFGSQANIKSVKVDLPKQLPSRLTTLQKACPEQQFAADPAGCPAASHVGMAKAITPLVPVALKGPAIFVSHGGAKFPELIVVLQGYGVTIDLHGETFINEAGVTSSTFRTVPDQPVGSFELTLPQGANSALAANGDLCVVPGGLHMPTKFTAQNGRVIHRNTPITVTGCPRHKAHKRKKSNHKKWKKK